MMTLVLTSVAATVAHPARFNGMFVSLNAKTAAWDGPTWVRDITAMKAVGMDFVVLPHLAKEISPPTGACPSGVYQTHFPGLSPAQCFHQISNATTTILRSANATNFGVHLGLAFQNQPDPRSDNGTVVRAYAWLQWTVAEALWKLAGGLGLSHVVAGFYTEQEESNSVHWLTNATVFATHYLNPLAADIKTKLRSDLLVWVSPYAVANRTRYSVKDWMLPSTFGALWEQTFAAWAPELDLVALQDSTGALANSYSDVRELLGNVSLASMRQHRSSWANVELFEVWPRSCQWPDECHGRHPAPFARIQAQLENEAPLLVGPAPKIIAWEWTSCMSPTPGNGAPFPDANRANYDAYQKYVLERSSDLSR
jgi:hypothetical protein